MRFTRFMAVALAAIWVAGCGPAGKSGGGKLRIQTSSGPVFDWDRCEEFGVKRCGDKLKVTSLIIKPLDCTVGGKVTGARPTMWAVHAVGTFGAHLQPPITYGTVPEHGASDAPAAQLKTGCKYMAQFGVMTEGNAGPEYLTEEFSW